MIAVLLLTGALLRPVLALAPEPIAVAPQYARSSVTLYEVLAEPGYLVPVARRTDGAAVTPGNAVAQLLAGPEAGPDLQSAFAPDAMLVGFEVERGHAVVDLGAGALEGVDASRAVDALVLTLTEFPQVSTVTLAVDGEYVDAEGSVVAEAIPLSRPVLNPETPAAVEGGIELYFAYGGTDRYLVPVTRANTPDQHAPAVALAALLSGPIPGGDLEAVLPGDVQVLDVRVEDGMAIVNFSPELVYAYRLSKANAMFVRRAVMATLTSLPGIVAGLIEIDGSRLLLYTCVNVTQEFPQARPWAINDEFYLTSLPRPSQTRA